MNITITFVPPHHLDVVGKQKNHTLPFQITIGTFFTFKLKT